MTAWVFAVVVTACIILIDQGLYALVIGLWATASVANPSLRVDWINNLHTILDVVVYVGTVIWVAVDSRLIGLQRYKGFVCGNPLGLALTCALFWIIVFPAYLQKRWKITHGKAELKPEFATPQG